MNQIKYLDKVFSDVEIKSANPYYSRSLISESMEIDTFSFDVFSDDTMLVDFTRNTPVTYLHNGNQMGVFYVQSISRNGKNVYTFDCTSVVGLLDEAYHNGGIYTGQTVREVVEDIFYPFPAYVKTNIQDISLYGWLPIASKRENLTQVLFAIGATLKTDYNGVIRIEGLWSGQTSEIGPDRMYSDCKITYDSPVTEVIVTEHSYNKSATEIVELFNGTASEGDKITFSDPYYDLNADGFSIIEAHENYAIVSAGSGTLTGKKYVHTTRNVSRAVSIKRLVEQSENVVRVENATLVSLVNSAAVADRLAGYYAHISRIEGSVVLGGEKTGDVVSIYNPYTGEMVPSCIEELSVSVSNTLKSSVSVLSGYTPPDISEQEYFDGVDVVTKSGDWTTPDGVTSIRVELIGAGRGGEPGADGEPGGDGSASAGNGGAGGSGGEPGEGGKIYQIELSVEPLSTHKIVIGTGGAQSTDGGDTTFDEYSSASGASSPSGFFEPISKITYALPGERGIDGGSGGYGGSSSTSWVGESGESVGSETGGDGAQPVSVVDDPTYGTGHAGGGGGGGSSIDENGFAGETGSVRKVDEVYELGPGTVVVGGKGGKGADATYTPLTNTTPGTGGNGGNGGGGGGGGGGSQGTAIWTGATGGAGGNGGPGGSGSDGCAIIYYTVKKETSIGKFVTKDGFDFHEKYDRVVVV